MIFIIAAFTIATGGAFALGPPKGVCAVELKWDGGQGRSIISAKDALDGYTFDFSKPDIFNFATGESSKERNVVVQTPHFLKKYRLQFIVDKNRDIGWPKYEEIALSATVRGQNGLVLFGPFKSTTVRPIVFEKNANDHSFLPKLNVVLKLSQYNVHIDLSCGARF